MSAIRADPAFHNWAQLIASRNAGFPPSLSFSTGRAPSCNGAPPRMTVVHPVSFEANEVVSTPEENTPDQAPAGPTFGQLALPQQLVTALERRGIRHPFAIQTSALPDALAGRD